MNDLDRYYETLELAPDASPEEVKQAYRDLARVWHPDRFAHDARLQQKAQERLKEINEAYEKLRNFNQRTHSSTVQPEPQSHQNESNPNPNISRSEDSHVPSEPPRFVQVLHSSQKWPVFTLLFAVVAFVALAIIFNQFRGHDNSSVINTKPESTINSSPDKPEYKSTSQTSPRVTEAKAPDAEAPNDVGSESIWRVSENVRSDLYAECQGSSDDKLSDCVSSFMKKHGASSRAIEFARLMKCQAFLISFREAGRVDVGRIYYIFRVNDNDALVFLNGTPEVIDAESPCCDATNAQGDLAECECQKGTDESSVGFHPAFQSITSRTNGGQCFVVRSEERSCHACEIESHIFHAYNFDDSGKFLSTRFISGRAVALSKKEPE
ncbi:MAG: hypothetical protein V7641_120 [Blastocatellia bacterium]